MQISGRIDEVPREVEIQSLTFGLEQLCILRTVLLDYKYIKKIPEPVILMHVVKHYFSEGSIHRELFEDWITRSGIETLSYNVIMQFFNHVIYTIEIRINNIVMQKGG